MLFLGSKKYPNSTLFVDHITQNGGKFNGYTDFENTAFFFKIHSEKFEHSFDIFSRFFIDPLFSSEYVEKEVNSVNSEFERNIQVDAKRREMILRTIAHPESLFHRFSTGNKKTLLEYTKINKINLKERVTKFYQDNYRPDNMKLIIYGNQSFEYYKKLVNDKFKDLKPREDKMKPNTYEQMPWEINKLGKLILYHTINNHQEIDISIMLEDIFPSLPDNSALYYKTLLNYKGEGSLDDVLRRHGLVAGIKSVLRKTTKGFSLFKIRGYVTLIGIEKLDKVISIIYKYIKLLRVKALDQTLFDYTKKRYDMAFFYNDKKKKTMKFIKNLCGTLWNYKRKFWFAQHKILGQFNEDKIKKFGERLILKNSIILIGNKQFDGLTKNYTSFVEKYDENEKLAETDPYFHTNFISKELKKDFIKSVDDSDNAGEFNKDTLGLFDIKKQLPTKMNLLVECKQLKIKKVNFFLKKILV